MHADQHPLAHQTVRLRDDIRIEHNLFGDVAGRDFDVEEWWDRVHGKSWQFSDGNPAALIYAMRTGLAEHVVPLDDEVVYGKINGLGMLIHVSELEAP